MRLPRTVRSGILVLTVGLGCAGASRPASPAVVAAPQTQSAPRTQAGSTALPNREDSLKFAVLGDFGSGTRQQYEVAEQMSKLRSRFPFELVITVGDNIYGSDSPQRMRERFETPYKALLDAGVKFYASLGNHDRREMQRHYKLFNMNGETYYTFKAPRQDVRFFALESSYMNLEQIGWVQKQLQESGEEWNIPYFHHPLYSSGDRHGSEATIRKVLEPLFVKYNVSVVFTGHDHIYERTKPQNGIVYFVVGSGGQLRRGNIDERSPLTARGFDTDLAFLAVEIDGDQMFFNALSRTGQVVDSGVITRRQAQ
jgi:predicted phosphodiesterase